MSEAEKQPTQAGAAARRAARAEDVTSRAAKLRLPDGSTFAARYDAAKDEWAGTLIVPGAGGGEGWMRNDRSGGIHSLLTGLGRSWRRTHPAEDTKERGTP